MSTKLQLSDYIGAIKVRLLEYNISTDCLSAIDEIYSKIHPIFEQFEQQNNTTEVEKELPSLSTMPQLNYIQLDKFTVISERLLDIAEQNFDNAWFFKHYKVDCPDYNQPLSLETLHSLGCDMTPLEYQKYKESVEAENIQNTEKL